MSLETIVRNRGRRLPKILVGLVLSLTVGLLLSACGGGGGSSGTAASATTADSTSTSSTSDIKLIANPPKSKELIREGTLTMCTETGTPPAAFYDENSNLSGYLPEIGDAISARMGLESSWVDSVFETIIIAANTGKCDAVIADQFITPEREAQITMIPYDQIGQQLLTTTEKASELSEATTNPSKLCGKTVAVLTGAAELETLEKWSKQCSSGEIKIVTFNNTPAGLQALQGDQADAFFTDSPISGYYAKQHSEEFALAGEPVETVEAGISVPKEKTGLQTAVREALAEIKQDGTYEEILSKWGQQELAIPNPGKQ